MVFLPSLTIRESPSISDIAATAISLIPRSKKSNDCDNDDTSSECEKPVSSDALTIGLGVGIPIGIIILVLSFFLLKNYRKDKKESLEHDPDFDENGEATALPDFPQTKQAYTMEDPFHNRNSLRYPPQGFNKSSASISASTTTKEDPYLDNFILPYSHQTGSKLSLDEYARHLGSNPGYTGTPRASNYGGARTTNSSVTNLNTLDARGNGNGHTSPQKSNLKMEILNANRDSTNGSSTLESKSPSKSMGGKKGEAQYTTIPNVSTASFNPEQFYNANDTLNESTTDVSDESAMKALDTSEKFGINYENESKYALNRGADNANHPDPTITDTANRLEDLHNKEVNLHKRAPSKVSMKSSSIPAPNLDMGIESPFEDKFSINRKPPTPASAKRDVPTAETSPLVVDYNSAHDTSGGVEGDFTFSTNNDENHDDNGTPQNKTISSERENNNEIVESDNDNNGKGEGAFTTPGHTTGRKSPRISAFNLLKNDSDDEDDTGNGNQKSLSPEQDEELKRMKSVYKVYFDRENSMKHAKRTGDLDEAELARQTNDHTFHHDPSRPLPPTNPDDFENANHGYLKINKDLKGDTSYDKRMTTTSSIYTETPIFTKEEQQQYYYQQQQMDPNFYGQHPLGSPNDSLAYQQPHPHYQEAQQKPKQPLPPLRSLPTASDIRKSTIQTYTDFQPRPKNQVASPSGRQPFNPIENDGVWTSPVTSPVNNSQPSFGNFTQSSSPHSGYTPPLSNGQQPTGPQTMPSATQLARSSVVMLNPVTEITKSRKFKPAGSLPSNSSPNAVTSPNSYPAPQFNETVSASDNDLIPGSRKSDVRRMMNTNF